MNATKVYQELTSFDLGRVQAILATGVPPDHVSNRGEKTALQCYTHSEHIMPERLRQDLVSALLKAGSNPNIRDAKGYGPLEHALCFDHLILLPTLLEHGACVNWRVLHQPFSTLLFKLWNAYLDIRIAPKLI